MQRFQALSFLELQVVCMERFQRKKIKIGQKQAHFAHSKSEFDSVTSILKGASEQTRTSSVKRQEAAADAADAAASQPVLQVLQEQKREQLELQRLEAEAKRKKEEPKDILCHETVADIKPPCPTSCLPLSVPSAPQPMINSSNQSTAELVKVLTDALNNNRIPVPEPSIFSGDMCLRKYVSGQAKTALDGYFLLGTESAYAAAWEILEERYRNPFTVAKAYRDKLQAWAKIGPKDSSELREFVDFLRSCKAAMVHIKALEILIDCNENRIG